jgi:hypothetical protein
MNSKIKDLLKDKKSILVFDVDGVLAPIEYGEYNHYCVDDEECARQIESGIDIYSNVKPIKTMQDFLKNKNMDNIYVITLVMNNKEFLQKLTFLRKNYNIKEENCYMVFKERDKLLLLNEIKEKYPDLEDKYIVFVEDTVNNLSYVMKNSNYSTVHISSFMQ